MLKILGRVFIVLLVTALIGAAIYFIVQATNGSSISLADGVEGQSLSGEFQGGGHGTGPRDGTGRGAGGGGGGGDHEEASFSSLSLLGLVKDLAIVALATIVIVLVKKAFSLRIPSTRAKTG